MNTLHIQIAVSNRHYQYLKQRAANENDTLNDVLAEIIEADIAWQKTLNTDPVASLFGQVYDAFDTRQIDEVVYGFQA